MTEIKVKWGKETLSLTVDLQDTVEKLKKLLEQITSVPAERQKIMGTKPSPNGDAVTLANAGVSAGKTLMMLGSADEAPKMLPTVPNKDTPAEVAAQTPPHSLPTGLRNIANTCYMNSAIQMIRMIPDIREILATQNNEPLLNHLGHLYRNMDTSREPVSPLIFWNAFIGAFRSFAELNEHGHPIQHDAQEALNAILQRIKEALPPSHVGLLGGTLHEDRVCLADETVPRFEGEVPFLMLPCNIKSEVQTLEFGLETAFDETLTLPLESQGREALFKRTYRIRSLPEYLFVHMIRFSWRRDINKNTKILKPVSFPLFLDVFSLCDAELKTILEPERLKVSKRRDKEFDRRREAKPKTREENPSEKPIEDDSSDTEYEGIGNKSGYYELCGVISHKGRGTDNGHYVFWGKSADQWMVYDDENVAAVSEEDIKRLRGVGEAHIAYVLMYRTRNPLTKKTIIPL